jgi:hypothetical protein
VAQGIRASRHSVGNLLAQGTICTNIVFNSSFDQAVLVSVV